MTEVDNWRELGQQLRVDSIRAANVTKSGHPTSSMSAADLMAVLMSKYLHYDYDQPENPNNDHLIFSKGHASPLALLDVQGCRRDHGRRAPHIPRLRQPHGRPSDPRDSVGRRRNRLARPGTADLGRRRARRQVPRQAAVPGLVSVRRQRDGRGLDVGGVRARRVLRAREPDRDHRREPARPARRDDARLGSQLVREAGARPSAGRRSRSTGTTSRRSTAHTRRRSTPRSADGDRRAHAQGQGRQGGREPAELAREGARPSRRGDRGAGRRSATSSSTSPSRESPPSRTFEDRAGELPTYEMGGKDVATRTAYGEALRALGNMRGDVVAVDGEVSNSTYAEFFRDGAPGPLLRDVHRRAADGRHGRRPPGAQVAPVRVHLRGVPLARLRLRPHGGDQSRANQPVRLARRRLDRRGRAVADGARGSRGVPRDPLEHRPLSVRREPDRAARRADGRPDRASSTCARPAALRR